MATLGGFSCSDRWKPDSTLTAGNGDGTQFQAYATIDTTLGLVFGSECLSCKMDVAKGSSLARTTINAATDEWCLPVFVKFTNDGAFSAPAVTAIRFFGTQITAAKTLEFKYDKNGVSTTTYLVSFWWDGVQIGAQQTITIGNTYRFGAYVKKGATGTGDCTFKVYVDDVTSGMTDTFAATLAISTTTATFTNAPSAANIIECGNSSGGPGLGNVIIKFGHASMIDTSAGGPYTDPVNRVLQPIVWSKKSVPVTVDASFNDWPTAVGGGDMADNAAGPDDATSYIRTATMVAGDPDKLTLWTISDWATVGYGTGDEVGCVRVSARASGQILGTGTVQIAAALREGGTNVFSSTVNGTWVSFLAGAGVGGIALQHIAPGSGVNWTPVLYSAAEMGARGQAGPFVGSGAQGGLTWLRADALFRMKAPAAGRRRTAQWV